MFLPFCFAMQSKIRFRCSICHRLCINGKNQQIKAYQCFFPENNVISDFIACFYDIYHVGVLLNMHKTIV
jgi:hypothetical protein